MILRITEAVLHPSIPCSLPSLNRKLESLGSPREKNLNVVKIDSFSTNDPAKSLRSEAQRPLPLQHTELLVCVLLPNSFLFLQKLILLC